MPNRFRMAIEFALHQDQQTALSQDDADRDNIRQLLDQLRRSGITTEQVSLEFAFRQVLEKWALRWEADPADVDAERAMNRLLNILDILPFQVNLWMVQNAAYEVVKGSMVPVSEESAQIAARLGVAAPTGN